MAAQAAAPLFIVGLAMYAFQSIGPKWITELPPYPEPPNQQVYAEKQYDEEGNVTGVVLKLRKRYHWREPVLASDYHDVPRKFYQDGPNSNFRDQWKQDPSRWSDAYKRYIQDKYGLEVYPYRAGRKRKQQEKQQRKEEDDEEDEGQEQGGEDEEEEGGGDKEEQTEESGESDE